MRPHGSLRGLHQGLEGCWEAMRARSSRPFCSCDSRWVSLWDLSVWGRYTTREGLTEIIVLNEAHLRRVLRSYVDYYHTWRVHCSLAMDAPVPRPVHPPELGDVRKLPKWVVCTTIMSGWRRKQW